MLKMNKKIRDDIRSLATASVDRKAFELRARFYFAASKLDDRLMHEALRVFVGVKTPLEPKPTNIVEMAKPTRSG
jgi:hypothetical protein